MRNVHFIPGTDVLASLPVLPLPNVVLLPGMVLPLNVHEPQYLELVDFVRARGMYVGVPLLLPPTPDEDGPALAPVFGLGKLVFHVELSDGRRIIRLEGVGRVRIQRELPRSHRFRELAVSPLSEPYPTDPEPITVLKAQVERITQYCGEDGEGLQSLLSIRDERTFLYSLTAFLPSLELLVCDEAEVVANDRALVSLQQRSLAAETADERVEFLLERTSGIVARLGEQFMSASRLLN
jgi:Lon protease-like protein